MEILVEYVSNIKGAPPLENKWNSTSNLNPMLCKASRCSRLADITSAVKKLRNLLSIEANQGCYSEEVLGVMLQAIGLINTDMEIVCDIPVSASSIPFATATNSSGIPYTTATTSGSIPFATATNSSGISYATATTSGSIPYASATTFSGFHNDSELSFGGVLGRYEDRGGYELPDGSILDDDFDIRKVLSDPAFPQTKNVQVDVPHVQREDDLMLNVSQRGGPHVQQEDDLMHNVPQREGPHVPQEDDLMLDHQSVKNAVFSRLTKMQDEIQEGKVQHDAALKALQVSGARWDAAEEARVSLVEGMKKLLG
ncbi:uncharacterized protein LOC113288526 [Papaver somniferum]|uniref:uncharacterized protein LOC113288526 n=1 Tax=Papaver somniferum TaxID=3469 RepID=UPI000E70125A|nr:uncharacterized protein LOC113288526 [Papaver somniferum]XP_026393387.1 uncharacterized protein LOC113288526 [Papaver somniferum]XP_026393388.1 uncharacterized protein LOC113288526 [Papaver somniferum]XP_026393390.1 uncharacterized protein LOC113288526 [Papaver somniferum]